ncbi:DUF72 domain-containing protein [Litchfieldia salsa]|uniref:Uncharacterized conserved protein YecE, DUF72 family n=1 Tax=Litchfieldia salsa TaxID=930152 RepID=A0A1H0WQ05_9BACI|nr:DUF72 domain-containing protein [Litchfieldia salsa]SDP92753.1 Uncharacterized conserved protein YecE, DUF72 family [Litchfieldia salsa]
MIYIGLTGWGDHDELYANATEARAKLRTYSSHFPIVEVDSSFYAIQPNSNVQKWVRDTPKSFQFIVKAYQGMTGHIRGEIPFESKEIMFDAFVSSLKPYQDANKLALVLFQFPPWFDCRKENVEYLRWCRQQMGDLPVALEFRHQSWFNSQYMDRTLAFMEHERWVHSICDEPQAGSGSIPTVLHPTSSDKTIVRFHGRNVHGWNRPNQGNWREVRYLYRYNEEELLEWAENLNTLQKITKNLYVLFNNNSGGDAAYNAKQLMSLLKINYHDLAPRQLNLFNLD